MRRVSASSAPMTSSSCSRRRPTACCASPLVRHRPPSRLPPSKPWRRSPLVSTCPTLNRVPSAWSDHAMPCFVRVAMPPPACSAQRICYTSTAVTHRSASSAARQSKICSPCPKASRRCVRCATKMPSHQIAPRLLVCRSSTSPRARRPRTCYGPCDADAIRLGSWKRSWNRGGMADSKGRLEGGTKRSARVLGNEGRGRGGEEEGGGRSGRACHAKAHVPSLFLWWPSVICSGLLRLVPTSLAYEVWTESLRCAAAPLAGRGRGGMMIRWRHVLGSTLYTMGY